jgi:tetratricopeptide (TPR) repeat protein
VCDAAIITPDDKRKRQIETLGQSSDATAPVVDPDKPTADSLARLRARLVELKEKLARSPRDRATMAEAAQAFEEYGRRRLADRQPPEAAEALRESVRLREKLTRDGASTVEQRERLANALTWLGKAHVQLKDHYAAANSFLRRLDLLEQIERERPSPSNRSAIAQTHLMFGELAEVRGDRAEALTWFARATEGDSEADIEIAAARLAKLVQDSPDLVDLLTANLKAAYRRVLDGGVLPSRPGFDPSFIIEVRKPARFARHRKEADLWHRLAADYETRKRTDDYRKALVKEYEAREQQVSLDDTRTDVKAAQREAALRLARSYLDAKQMSDAAVWTERAAILGHAASLLQFADWCEKSDVVKRDPEKAARYRHFGHLIRGNTTFAERRYEDALPDFKRACEWKQAGALAYNKLAMCYGKLGRWDEAVAAYMRSIELDLKSPGATGVVLNLLEALVAAERPEQLLKFIQTIKAKGWEPSKEGEENALFHGFRSIALLMSGKDASEAERSMRQFTGKAGFKITGWTWDEINGWLKTTRLAPDRKAAVEKIVAELQGESGRGDGPRDGAR